MTTGEGATSLRRLAKVVGESTKNERILRKSEDIVFLHVGIYLHGVLCHTTLADEMVTVAVGLEVVRRVDEIKKCVHTGTLDAAKQRENLRSDIHDAECF